MNFLLIAANIGVHVYLFYHIAKGGNYAVKAWQAQWQFSPTDPQLHQFFTCQFLHQDWIHLLGNMLFLYIFGNHMEDRLGPLGYLGFYLAGGVVAVMGHTMVSSNPVIGASGAISAVTGGFMVLFPAVQITIGTWLLYIFFFEVSGLTLVIFQFLHDLFRHFTGGGNVAYMAHIAGMVFGFVVALGTLKFRLLAREPYDLLALWDRYRRRRQMRSVAASGKSPWLADAGKTLTPAPGGGPIDQEVAQLRSRIGQALRQGDGLDALSAYERILAIAPEHTLPHDAQLEVANFAMQAQRFPVAAHAYENFLRQMPHDPNAGEIALLQGMIYARYMDDPRKAAQMFELAVKKLPPGERQDQARRNLAEIHGAPPEIA